MASPVFEPTPGPQAIDACTAGMGRLPSQARLRLTAALASRVITCVVAASPASAAPPVGTQYRIDGSETFAAWDAASQHVSDKVVSRCYRSPFALAGNVDGGTNVGGYRLACNPGAPAPTLASAGPPPEIYVGADGGTVGSAAKSLPGYYRYIG